MRGKEFELLWRKKLVESVQVCHVEVSVVTWFMETNLGLNITARMILTFLK